MGAWETLQRVIKSDYPDLDYEIRNTISIGSGQVVLNNRIKKLCIAFCFIEELKEWQLEEMIHYHARKIIHPGNRTPETLERIEGALGFKLEEWQKDYIMSEGIGQLQGRKNGKTTAHILKTLLIDEKPLEVYRGNLEDITDEQHGRIYENFYLDELLKTRERLAEKGVPVREIKVYPGRRRTQRRNKGKSKERSRSV